ncbi:MAG: hypothetical protein KC468_24875, partial [Myxococcales bacterium]|nr:hypothetical protein [Myxococcales bacterium]
MSGSLETSRGSSPAPDRAAVLQYFARDHRPCWFTAESFVHITGLERAIPGLRYLSHTDPTDGACARVTVPRGVVERTRFANSLEVVNYLLGHPEGARAVRAAGPGRALFLFFDERTEAACAELGVELAFPSAALRRALDDKREALRTADAVGLRCAPGVLARVTSYARLRALAADAGLQALLERGDQAVLDGLLGEQLIDAFGIDDRTARRLRRLRELDTLRALVDHPKVTLEGVGALVTTREVPLSLFVLPEAPAVEETEASATSGDEVVTEA